MGLAHLEWIGPGDGGHRFAIDIGTNRYFRYAIGDEATTRRYGMELLTNPHHVSGVEGPLPDPAMGRSVLTIQQDAFDDDHRRVQITSYRSEQLTSPSVSNIVSAPLYANRGGAVDTIPEIAFARARDSDQPRLVAVAYSAKRAEHSEALFLGALFSALPTLLPSIAPLIQRALPGVGQLVSGLIGGSGGGNQQAEGTIAQIAEIVKRVLQTIGSSTASQNEAQHVQAASYSGAMVAPAAIVALLPLLQKVLTPETIQTLIKTVDPNRLLGTTIEGIKAVGRLGIDSAEQDNRHIRELHPGNDDPLLLSLLAAMGTSLSLETPMRGSHKVGVHIADGPTHMIGGRPRVLYRNDSDLRPQISVDTPRPLGRAILEIRLKQPDTLKVVHHDKMRLTDVGAGSIAEPPAIPAAVLGSLPPGEYLLCATLRWKTGSGDVVGADRRQLITLMGPVIFDHVEPGGEVIALNDVNVHRDYWHEIWRTELTRPKHRYRISVRYLVVVEPFGSGGGRMTTDVAERLTEGKVELRIRSGAAYTVDQLNGLLSQLGRHPLEADQLAALGDEDVLADMAGEALASERLSGRPGRAASLWVYPEVRLQPTVMQRATEILPSGQVIALTPETVEIPVPSLIHLLGARGE